MKTNKFFSDVKEMLNKFGPEILSGCAIIFTGLAIKSAIDHAQEAAKVVEEYETDTAEFAEMTESSVDRDAVKKVLKTKRIQKNIELAMVYKWSFIFGFGSVVCMVCSTKLSGSKIAAAYALAKLNEDKLKIALEKTKEMFGEEGENAIRTKIAKDLGITNKTPIAHVKNPGLNQPIMFIDEYTGAPVETTMEDIEKAIETAKGVLKKNHILSYKKWLLIFGYPVEKCRITDVGWNVFNPFDVEIVQETIEENEIYYIKYKNLPTMEYKNMTK